MKKHKARASLKRDIIYSDKVNATNSWGILTLNDIQEVERSWERMKEITDEFTPHEINDILLDVIEVCDECKPVPSKFEQFYKLTGNYYDGKKTYWAQLTRGGEIEVYFRDEDATNPIPAIRD